MVQLDGGRFATSDLNDLYRRVINRNNRLKRLLDLGAPEIIVNNEKRMLQEAVDALFDNGRRGRAVTGPGNRPLKSLSDMLKGKQGRFRQNLLGKRVDYSGRSVIVAGPSLKLHQCGLPKLMALELFKPFIMSRLVERKSVQNIKAAKKYVDSMTPEVWDVLEEVIAEHPVLLNRAPTLHRLGIQAFEPMLVEGKAIQVHPLVCHAFNADFDGDQMAVHLPLSAEAQAEARILMLSSNNILSPASGRPLATPTQDMVLGIYYLTYSDRDLRTLDVSKLNPHPRRFDSADEIEVALEMKAVGLQEPIEFRFDEELHLTTPGRVLFNSAVYRALDELLPPDEELEFDFVNQTLAKPDTDRYVLSLSDRYGAHTLAPVLDTIKTLGFRYATKAGVTISKNDIVIPPDKEKILGGFEERVEEVHGQYDMGLITEDERHETIVNIWTEATEKVAAAMENHFDELNPVFMMANSGARGSMKQIRQLAGMRGLMANPKGEIIERPIKANFMEGLSVLEYFISTHGARKGLADTALRTADSGYLTRRLVDVSQDVIVRQEDCGTDDHIDLPLRTADGLNKSLLGRVVSGDVHKPLASGKPGKTVVVENGTVVTLAVLEEIEAELGEETTVPVRSVLKCRAETGVCQTCYGIFPATGEMCEIGDAVGIIAAQSIGEPGTQLTMRTFHTGGVAGADITHGLPRVVEIFEARNPKGAAMLAEVGGTVGLENTERGPKITVTPNEVGPNGELGDPIEYQLPRRTRLLVGNGQLVEPGDAFNEGSQNPTDLLALKGSTTTELYLVGEVQKVYKSQGVEIHDKHIELIVRQMLKKVRVETNGDTDLLPGPARRQGRLRARERQGEGEGREGDERAAHPRHHQGVARHRVVPVGGVVPGDDEGADRRVDRGQDRPAARAEGERDHREADPGGHGPEAVPDDRDRARGADRARGVRAGHAPAGARGDRPGRHLRDRLRRPRDHVRRRARLREHVEPRGRRGRGDPRGRRHRSTTEREGCLTPWCQTPFRTATTTRREAGRCRSGVDRRSGRLRPRRRPGPAPVRPAADVAAVGRLRGRDGPVLVVDLRAAGSRRRRVELHRPAAAAGEGREDRLLRPLPAEPRRHAVEAGRSVGRRRARGQAVRHRGSVVGLRDAADRVERARRREPADAVDADDCAVPRERARARAAARRARRAAVPAPAEAAVHARRGGRRLVAAGGAGRRPRARGLLQRPVGLEAGRGARQPPPARRDADAHGGPDPDRDPDEPASG